MKNLPNIQQFKNIAIIQTAFIGDSVLAIYLASAIKAIHPNSKITFVSTPVVKSLLECSNDIDSVISYDKRKNNKGLSGIKFIADKLKKKDIDCIITPHRSLRSTLLTLFSKPKYSVGFNINSFSFLYKKRIKYYIHLHEIFRNNQLLRAFNNIDNNILYNKPLINLHFNDFDINYTNNLLRNINKDKLIAIAPGSVWKTKRWNENYFIELALLLKSYGYEVIIIGSEQEGKICELISSKSETSNFAGKTSLQQLVYLLSFSKLLITNDSSPIHLAGLVNCPTIAIFGPTSPIFGFAPLGENDIVIEKNELLCKPCAIHGGNTCPIGTHECMNNIHPSYVFQECIKFL